MMNDTDNEWLKESIDAINRIINIIDEHEKKKRENYLLPPKTGD